MSTSTGLKSALTPASEEQVILVGNVLVFVSVFLCYLCKKNFSISFGDIEGSQNKKWGS